MTEEQQLKFNRLIFPATKEDVVESFNIYKDFLFRTTLNHQATTYPIKSDMRLILQMMFTKLTGLEKISEGIIYTSSDGIPLKEVIDQTLVIASLRGLYETMGMFNIVFVTPKTREERGILYLLWIIAGLKYKQKFNTIRAKPDSISNAVIEKEHIDKYIQDIYSTDLYKSLHDKDKKKVDNAIEGLHYNIMFKDGKVKGLSGYQDLVNNTGIQKDIMSQFYTHLSLHAHPSYISVVTFKNMFKTENPDFFSHSLFTLDVAFKLICVFIADYIKVNPEVIDTFNDLDLVSKCLIQENNIFLRGESYKIV